MAIAASSVASALELDATDALELCETELTDVELELDELLPHPTATNSPNVHTANAGRATALVANTDSVILTPSSIAESVSHLADAVADSDNRTRRGQFPSA